MKKLLVALLILFATPTTAHASVEAFFFSDRDPQPMLKKQYKAFVMTRTFTPGIIRNYRKRLIDTSKPLPKSIRLFVDTNIGWTTYAKSIFGSNWSNLSKIQKRNFKALLRKMHLRKYGRHFSPDIKFSARFNKPTWYRLFKGGELAKVSTMFVTTKRNVKFDVDFVFRKVAQRWVLCDVHVDGVSHARVYRSQVRRIYSKQGYDGVMKAFQRALDKS